MNRGVLELGHLIRSFREERGLTQLELAQAVGSSRSAIALMEQGRRLLMAGALHAVAAKLGLPPKVVAPFLSVALQSRRNKVAPQPASFVPFRLLCVSGISGSGKTTLAEVVARSFGIERIGSHPSGRAYLQDLATDQDRWAFEAQVAFLVSKTSDIRQRLEQGESLVVERWIEEDIMVYERLFEEAGAITGRSRTTFQSVSNLAREILPQPEYHIYCQCSAVTGHARIHSRARPDSSLHSLEHITRSKALYDEWLEHLEGPEVYVLDTDHSDLSAPGIIEEVFRDIEWILGHDIRDPQLTLFEQSKVHPARFPKHLRPYRSDRWSPLAKTRRRAMTAATPLVAPVAYLAAPFSGRDTEPSEPDSQARMFANGRGHGVIPRAGFRNDLLGVERALQGLGFSVLLPHRDVNEWGRKHLTPEAGMRECTDHVLASDLFVGLLGASCGAHYEFGLALAAGKPSILIDAGDVSTSFLASGVSVLESADVLHLSCPRLRDAEGVLSSSDSVARFVERHFSHGTSLL